MSTATIVNDVLVNVRRAIRAQLLTIEELPSRAEQQQWEGLLDFKPPEDGSAWFRETMLRQPGAPARKSIGTNARIRHTGGYQVSLFYPPNGGADVYDVERMAGLIRDAFPFSLSLCYDGQVVTCDGVGIATVQPVTQFARPYLHCPVRITWWADTFNPI